LTICPKRLRYRVVQKKILLETIDSFLWTTLYVT